MSQDQFSPTSRRTVREDLAFLAAAGLRDNNLEQCSALTAAVLHELAVDESVSPGARIILLNKTISEIVSEQRLQAFEQRNDGTYRSAAKKPAFQVAAAGELLGLTDEAMFDALSEQRCAQFGETWEMLKAKDDNKGSAAETQLRAALWVGGMSARNVAADRQGPKLLAALEAAIKVHARHHRADLRMVLAGQSKDEAQPSDQSPVPATNTEPEVQHDSGWLTGAARRRLVGAGIGTLLTAAAAGVAVLLTTNSATNQGSTPENTPEPTSPPSNIAESTGPQRINEIAACSGLPRDSQWARELRSRKQVVVDGRCYPDPALQVGAQAGPGRTFPSAAVLDTGQVLEDICLKGGQPTKDMVGSSSSVWVQFKLDDKRRAFVSAIWVQGEDGAEPC